MPVAVHGAVGRRHGRRDEDAAGAFGEALGAPNAPHRAEAGAAAKAQGQTPGARPHRGLVQKRPRSTTRMPKDGHCGKVVIDGKLTLTGSPDQPDDADEADDGRRR